LPHWHLSKTAVPRDPANRHDERLKFCSGETKISWKANTLAFFLASARMGAHTSLATILGFHQWLFVEIGRCAIEIPESRRSPPFLFDLIPRLYNDIIDHYFYRIPGISAAFSKLRRLKFTDTLGGLAVLISFHHCMMDCGVDRLMNE